MPAHDGPQNKPPRESAIRRWDWRVRVFLRLGELERVYLQPHQPIRRLVLLKQAICEVTLKLHRGAGLSEPVNTTHKIALTMRFLRAIEQHK